MSSDILVVPVIAEDANYDAGAEAWSSQPTKVAPSAGYEAKGWIPGASIPAEYENYHRHGVSVALADAQRRAAVKPLSAGIRTRNTGGNYAWMTRRKCLIGTETISAAFKLVECSADMQLVKDTAYTTIGLELCTVNYLPVGTGAVGLFRYGQAGGGNDLAEIDDSSGALTVTARALPTGTARYHSACTDVTTGNAVLLSGGGGSGGSAYGFAYGDTASLTWVSFSGWTADVCSHVASKPGEVRAFSKAKAAYSTTGGASPTVESVTWTGATAPTGTDHYFCCPTWDERNNRWVTASADLYAYDTSAPKIWTSLNGKDWDYLVSAGDWLIAQMAYHEGWLWAIAANINNRQPGFQVIYSADGGETWEEPNIAICLDRVSDIIRSVDYPNTYAIEEMSKYTKIAVCSDSLLFQVGGLGSSYSTGTGVAYRSVWTG